MQIKGLIDEDFVNYKHPSMYICTSVCDFKCDKESGVGCCQNSSLAKLDAKTVSDDDIIKRYVNNPITKAIVFGGLEPFEQFSELFNFISKFRFNYNKNDPIIIYTGFYKEEISHRIEELKQLRNIIVKFGRFIPNQTKKYDDVLGVYLASSNQYAEKIC